MSLTAERILAEMLFALMHTLLLAGFIGPGPGRTAPQRGALLLGCALAQALIRRFESLDGLTGYLFLSACIGAAFAFIRLWSGLPWKAALQRALCYVLLTECVTLTLCHLSQELLGADIFRTLPLRRELPAMIAMGLCNALLLRVLRHFLPPEALVDGNSLTLSLLSAVPGGSRRGCLWRMRMCRCR